MSETLRKKFTENAEQFDALMVEMLDENITLREMLAFSYSGTDLYHDDGELQDNKKHPFIDFKRDSTNELLRKFKERAESPNPEGEE